MSYCNNCKTNDGPHFVPPCVGEPGFFMCDSPEKRHQEFRTYYESILTNYASGSPKWKDAKTWLEMNQ